ncbi:hypothetical protein C1645_836284 [Glomus cerebriforme]|uniref:Ion transport domain-containing protein n=1 Tax=Glomus cerebriforme TaxID=658196 RepID=A0A397SAV6_9GLOM|nr:hypothetical protein C1645_836284 [Glomus cerebriforme]
MSDNLSEDIEKDSIFDQKEGKWGSDLIGGIFIPPGKSKSSLQKEKLEIKYENQIDALVSEKDKSWHISISPDGENFLTFNHETLEFKILTVTGKDQNLNKVHETKPYKVNAEFKIEKLIDNKFSKWIVAISNCVTPETEEAREVLVAISRVTISDMSIIKKKNPVYDIKESDELKMIEIDGKKTFTHDLRDLKDMKHFHYPISLQIELENKENIHILQLYNLNTMRMEQIFDVYDGKSIGKSIFASSNNERIIVFSSGFKKISLFLIENGLEIASKDFGNGVKILFCEFINDDETLIIIIRRPEHKLEVLFWNLFNTKDTIKFGKNIRFVKNEENTTSISRIPGKLITINTDGQISSIFDSLINDCENYEEGAEIHSIVICYDKNKEGTPRRMPQSYAKSKYDVSMKHKIYHRRDLHAEETTPLIDNKEPWIIDNYERISVYLDENENIQLFIGRSTVQVWRKSSEKKIELEYIWTNNVEVGCEEKWGLEISDLIVGERCFYLKVRWNELKDGEFFEVKWPYRNHVTPINHACDALEHLNYRRNKLVGDKKQQGFEDMKDRISYIIWRFIKNKPDIWQLMDVRFDIMAKVIIGGTNMLVKYILFGDGKEKNWNLHVPRINRWDNKDEHKFKKKNSWKKVDIKKNLSDLQIAIRLCKGGIEGNRRSLIVAYLLEYYTENSLRHIGWLITVSEALPELYEYRLENYVRELFYKRCISGWNISNLVEYVDITPREIAVSLKESNKLRAFNPTSKLISTDKPQNNISLFLSKLYLKIFPNFSNQYPIVKVIPLYNFTVIKIFKLVFIPRGYLDNKKNEFSKRSPLIQISLLENGYDIFDSPAMEAAINYKWDPARNYFFRNFLVYILYTACFAILAGCYLGHIKAIGLLCDLLFLLFILYYYFGLYLFFAETRKFWRHGWRLYKEFSNFIDLASIVISLVITSFYITPTFSRSNAFADIITTPNITAAISFTMLILWLEFILFLRYLSSAIAKYLFIISNIIKETYLFIVFMLLVILVISHVFLLLLQHSDFPDLANIKPKTTSLTIFNNNGEIIGKSQQDFDKKQDNPSKDFGTSFLSTYSWLRDTYPQDDAYNYWAVQALTLIGSLFLIVIQNLILAFIWKVHDNTYEKGHAALLRYRAKLISDYEALDVINFSPPPKDPKYIYYVGKSKRYDAWMEGVEKREKDNVKLYDDYEKYMIKTTLSFKEKDEEDSWWNYDNNDNNNCDDDVGDDGDDDKNEEMNIDAKIALLNGKIDKILKALKLNEN